MSVHFSARAWRPEHRHRLTQPGGLPPVVKASIAVALLPVVLAAAVVLSLRAEMAPHRLAAKPPADPCGLLVGEPGMPRGPAGAAHHLCLH